MTWDGIPCVYYGTEQGFAGGVDPKNREDMFRGNRALGYAPFATDHATFKCVQGLIQMRKDNVALRRGTVDAGVVDDGGGRAPRRRHLRVRAHGAGDETVLVVLNASTQSSETCAPATEGGACLKTTLPAGSTLTDVMPGSDGADVHGEGRRHGRRDGAARARAACS